VWFTIFISVSSCGIVPWFFSSSWTQPPEIVEGPANEYSCAVNEYSVADVGDGVGLGAGVGVGVGVLGDGDGEGLGLVVGEVQPASKATATARTARARMGPRIRIGGLSVLVAPRAPTMR
jgi:hypothetical protein